MSVKWEVVNPVSPEQFHEVTGQRLAPDERVVGTILELTEGSPNEEAIARLIEESAAAQGVVLRRIEPE